MLPCNFNHLYYFYRVAVHKSVSKASKELLIAQSALSTQLKQLEESLEMTLFNRTKEGMKLTERGEILFTHASQMFETYEDMKRAMVLAEKQVRGPMNLASVHSVGNYLLPPILAEYHRVYPDVQINLELHTSNRVMEMLQENQVDLAIIAWDRQYPLLSSTVILQNHLVLAAHPKHPLARKRNPTVADLAEHQFLGYEPGTPTRVMIDAHFKNLGHPLSYIMEPANIATMKQLCIAGMGLAFLPAFAVKLETKLKMLKVIPVSEASLDRPITMYWKERRVLTRPAQKFVEFVQAWGKKNGDKKAGETVAAKSDGKA